jgi:transcriptional antiterminator NusG
MSASNQLWDQPSAAQIVSGAAEVEVASWYAVQTRARHERIVAERLQGQDVTTFLPLVTELRRWSDRSKSVESPLFSCYLFVKVKPTHQDRLRILRDAGVFSFVGNRGQAIAIPDEQIEAIETLVTKKLSCHPHPFLKIGQRVRIRSGALSGVEGILVSRNGDRTLVVSVDAIQRSLAVSIEGYDVEPV